MKYNHKVVLCNENDEIVKTCWESSYDSFDITRLFYELIHHSYDSKNKDLFMGVIEVNGYEWLLDLDKHFVLPSGEELILSGFEPTKVELSYIDEHSQVFLVENKFKKVK